MWFTADNQLHMKGLNVIDTTYTCQHTLQVMKLLLSLTVDHQQALLLSDGIQYGRLTLTVMKAASMHCKS